MVGRAGNSTCRHCLERGGGERLVESIGRVLRGGTKEVDAL